MRKLCALLLLASCASTRQVSTFPATGLAPPGELVVIEAVEQVVCGRWPDRCRELLADVKIEWVDIVRSPLIPDGYVYQGCSGGRPKCLTGDTLARRCPASPWTCYLAAIIKNSNEAGVPWKHARESALAHALILHVVSRRLERGDNLEHTDPELAELLNKADQLVAKRMTTEPDGEAAFD